MRTSASPALAKTVRPVPALSSRCLRGARAVLRSLHRLALTVHIGTIIAAIHLALVWRSATCNIVVWLSRRLSLRDYLLGQKNNGENECVDESTGGARKSHGYLLGARYCSPSEARPIHEKFGRNLTLHLRLVNSQKIWTSPPPNANPTICDLRN
jgi:hypothetical protein